jgi:hypothetical protein
MARLFTGVGQLRKLNRMPQYLTDTPVDALEFEILVARAGRRGHLDIAELLDAFATLAAHYGQDLADPRRLDAELLGGVVASLPPQLAEAQKVHVVAKLEPFGLNDDNLNAFWPAAWADANTLLVACPEGMPSLQALAVALCTIAHEGAKWRHLLADAPQLRAALCNDEPAALAAAAVPLGQHPEALAQAFALSRGTLWTHLAQQTPVQLQVHPELAPPGASSRGRRARGLWDAIAELGLGHRPLHLWLGPQGMFEPISPYSHDLGPKLAAWAQAQTEGGVATTSESPASARDVAYAALPSFLRRDPRLAEEKATSERTVGLQQLPQAGVDCQLLDTARLDPAVWDPRLAADMPAARTPIILRMDGSLAATFVAQLLALLPPNTLRAVTVLSSGMLPAGHSGHVAPLSHLTPWHGGVAVPLLPHPDILSIQNVTDQGAQTLPGQACIDVPFSMRGAPAAWHAQPAAQPLGVTFAQWPMAQALCAHLYDAAWAPKVPVNWFVVQASRQTARLDVQHAAAVAAIGRAAMAQALKDPASKPPAGPAGPAPAGDRPTTRAQSFAARYLRV